MYRATPDKEMSKPGTDTTQVLSLRILVKEVDFGHSHNKS
jgi:hypothetical protein